jgi:peroxiredoxin
MLPTPATFLRAAPYLMVPRLPMRHQTVWQQAAMPNGPACLRVLTYWASVAPPATSRAKTETKTGTMSRIEIGQTAPEFALQDLSGKRFSLAEALARGPVVAAFFKTSCPVCQYTFPFLERLFKAYGNDRATFCGISQDNAERTAEFNRECGVTFPTLLDKAGYPVSNEYGLTTVPTYYLISSEGTVQVASVGFSKKALEQISAELARLLGRPAAPVFLSGEIVPELKPG